MQQHSRTRVGIILGLLVTMAITACSLIVDTNTDQCSKDGDCATIANGASAVCQAGVCVSSASTIDGSSGNDGPAIDGPNNADATCTPKTATQDDFLNDTCTTAECIPFDNCARIGVCDGGALPDLIAPPDGGF